MNAGRSLGWVTEVTRLVRIVTVLAIVVLVTLPFGFYRAYTRKLSLRWFLAIHLPVPLIFLARFESHLSYAFIPFTSMAFAAAQLLGARAGRWWQGRRPLTHAADKE
jgi:hypothetical protein